MKKGERRKKKGETVSGERGAVSGTLRMAVVAKPATKSADSSASVNKRPDEWKFCEFCGFLCETKTSV